MPIPRPSSTAVLLLWWLAASDAFAGAPSLVIDPPAGLMDSIVKIHLVGAPPRRETVLRASATDGEGAVWRSEAAFRSDRRGNVDAARQSPSRGTYEGADPMGLFWSMRRQAPATSTSSPRAGIEDILIPPAAPNFPRRSTGAVDVRVEALVDGRVVASTLVTRRWTGTDLTVTDVREDGLVGRLHEPPGQRLPAVLVLSGSNGGIQPTHAPILAAHGYVTFSLAYFRAPGLPKDLVEIPLEYLKGGIDWLRSRPSVDPARVAVLGVSRGAELALLLGASYPEIRAVVGIAPSHVVWEGALRDPEKKGIAALRAERSAWTREGRPLPFVPKSIGPGVIAKMDAGQPFAAIEMMRIEGLDPSSIQRAAIPVERISGPVFLVSSRADRMWPSAEMAAEIVRRLKLQRFPHRLESWTFGDAPHVFPDGWIPVAHGGSLGGSAAGAARAFAGYWPRLLAFLDAALPPEAVF